MAWPGIAEFSSAIQNPVRCFADPELSSGELAVYDRGGRAGMPVVSAGNFAAVYRVSNQGRSFAVRCFTRAVNDQHARYGQLDTFLRATLPPAFVEFEYLEQGILVAGDWYPLVKMEWVNGEPMNKFVESNLNTPNSLQIVAARWRGLVSALGSLNIAHNDLQHGNVMVQQDRSLRLVDYDAMFLPQYAGQASPENGHQHFQHPLKTSQNYNESVDNFPALVIYVSLLALAADPGLWNRFYNDDNLLLRRVDYGDPANSQCFQALKSSQDDTVRYLTAYLEQCCSFQVEAVPNLESILNTQQGQPAPAPIAAPPLAAPAPAAVVPPPVMPAPPPVAPPPMPPSACCAAAHARASACCATAHAHATACCAMPAPPPVAPPPMPAPPPVAPPVMPAPPPVARRPCPRLRLLRRRSCPRHPPFRAPGVGCPTRRTLSIVATASAWPRCIRAIVSARVAAPRPRSMPDFALPAGVTPSH